jgi:hypothetical protein
MSARGREITSWYRRCGTGTHPIDLAYLLVPGTYYS